MVSDLHFPRVEVKGVLSTKALPKTPDPEIPFILAVSITLRAERPITIQKHGTILSPKSALYDGVLEIVDAFTGTHVRGGKTDYLYVPPTLTWDNEAQFLSLVPDKPFYVDIDLAEWRVRQTLLDGQPGLSHGLEDQVEQGKTYRIHFMADHAVTWWAWGTKEEILQKPKSIWDPRYWRQQEQTRAAEDLKKEDWIVPVFVNDVGFLIE